MNYTRVGSSKISHLLRVLHYPCRLAWHWRLNHAYQPLAAGVARWPQHTTLAASTPSHSQFVNIISPQGQTNQNHSIFHAFDKI